VLQDIVGSSQDSKDDDGSEGGFDVEIDRLPNIAELFDLFPYVMYYSGGKEIDNDFLHEFKYSYPLGK
jgi:hypothetical protein